VSEGVHQIIAEQFGIDEAALTGRLTDLSTADVDNHIRPPRNYLGKLPRDPSKVSPVDARAILTAGVGRACCARRSVSLRPVRRMNRFGEYRRVNSAARRGVRAFAAGSVTTDIGWAGWPHAAVGGELAVPDAEAGGSGMFARSQGVPVV